MYGHVATAVLAGALAAVISAPAMGQTALNPGKKDVPEEPKIYSPGAVTLRCIGRRRSTTTQFQAAAVTSCHLSIAAARNCRSVRRDMRWS